MKARTSEFKNALVGLKETKTKITYGSIELGDEQLNSIQPHYEGAILKSTMKQLDLDSNVEIPKDTIINLQFGVKVREASGNDDGYDYINYGNYIVQEIEKQEDTNSYLIKCYDKMLYSMKDYEAFATYPITIRDYINALCSHIGLTFKNANDYFTNYDKTIEKELYLDDSGNSLNYTFRDVLDELAQVTASTICINENDDELEIRYITNAGETTTNVSGTNLSITSEDSQTNKIELLGNTTQNTTTGKSLLNPNRIEQTTSHGITVSYDANTQVITFNGTCDTDNTTFYFTNSYLDVPTATSGVTTMTAYYVSGSITNFLTWRINDSGWSTIKQLDLLDIATSKKKSLTSNATFTLANNSFSFRFNNGSKATNLKLKIMVANSTNTDYEPYTNGISPNPSYPQDIINVTGRQEVKCVGNQLIDYNKLKTTGGASNSYSFENNILSITGTSGTYNNYYIDILDLYKANAGKYLRFDYDSINLSNQYGTAVQLNIRYNDGTANAYIVLVAHNGTIYNRQIPNDTSNINFAQIAFYSNNSSTSQTSSLTITKPMFHFGNSKIDYEPYKEETYEINLGKNLFNATSGSTTYGNLTITKNSDNSFTLNGSNGNSTYWYRLADNFTLPAGAYTLSNSNPDVSNNGAIFCDDGGNFTARTNNETKTFTNERTIKPYIRVAANATFNNFTIYPMIEKGTQATSYSPYFTPIELCKIGTYQDKIFKNSGKNLFDKDNANVLNAKYGATITADSNERMIYIPCKPNTTYTLYHLTTSPMRNSIGTTQTIPAIGTTIDDGVYSSTSPKTITTNANAKYIVWQIYAMNDTTTTLQQMLDSIMINEGNTALDYEPYGNGEWYKKEVIKKVIFNGSEDWTYQSQYSRFYTYLTNGALQSERANSKSNYYVYGNTETTNNTFFISSANSVLIRNTNITSSADFQTWLSTHNTIVYYVLATPTYTKLNDALQEQLNSIRLLEGINNVMSSVPIDLTYVSGIDTLDEEYFNEDNVNFGEMYGPVNTIILSRSAESDEIAQSIPSNLSDDEKVAIKIKENQIMNFDNRDEFLYGILTRLYGLRYTQNDYSSKGICYYNVCDRYKANIFGKDYYCVMLNDDVTIESGLSENVFTELPETAQTDYSKTSTSDRIERQTTLIVDKQAGEIRGLVSGLDNEINGDNGIESRLSSAEVKINNHSATLEFIEENTINEDGSVKALKTSTDYTFDSEGLKIGKSTDDYNSLQDNTGTYYYEKDTMIGKYTKDGSVQKDLALFGKYYYGIDETLNVATFTRDDAKFIAQLYTNSSNEEGFGHFYNGS